MRPITLLNAFYKLISGCLSQRLKSTLNFLISETQSVFMKGRYIGENTRFIYYLMAYTESKNIPGLFMLIDFEKAFDSISWSFIYNVLHFFGFKMEARLGVNSFFIIRNNFFCRIIENYRYELQQCVTKNKIINSTMESKNIHSYWSHYGF